MGKKDFVMGKVAHPGNHKYKNFVENIKNSKQGIAPNLNNDVVVIGAVEPDAIMVIQELDMFGDVIKSFIRNPKKPDELFVYRGDLTQIDQNIEPDSIISIKGQAMPMGGGGMATLRQRELSGKGEFI